MRVDTAGLKVKFTFEPAAGALPAAILPVARVIYLAAEGGRRGVVVLNGEASAAPSPFGGPIDPAVDEWLWVVEPPPGTARFGFWVVTAELAGVPIGYAWAVPSPGDDIGSSIEEVAVVPSHRRKGIGTKLVVEVAEWMTELGRPHLTIFPLTGSH